MNPKYKCKVQELQKLLDAGVIYPIKESEGVVAKKKNGKSHNLCGLYKIEQETIKDPFPAPFTE
jgi:hypothetical protein